MTAGESPLPLLVNILEEVTDDAPGVSTSKAHKSGSGFTPGPFDRGKPGRSNTWVVERAGGRVSAWVIEWVIECVGDG